MSNALLKPKAIDASSESSNDFIFECNHPGKPLVISFSYAHWDAATTFDFFGRLKKIEGQLNEPFNRIYLRDPKSRWYHYGVDGLGNNIDEVVTSLKSSIGKLQPSEVITIGQSMGAYAALIFGALLEADKVIAFAPLAFIDSEMLESYSDHRYLTVLKEVCKSELKAKYLDVVSLYKKCHRQPKVHVIFGTQGGNTNEETVQLDAMHAFKLQQITSCKLHPYPETNHLVVKHLSEMGKIDVLLLDLMFGVRLVYATDEKKIDYGWYKWIFDNLLAGCTKESLIKNLTLIDVTEKATIINAINDAESNGYFLAAKEMKKTLEKRNWLLSTCDQLASLDKRYSSCVERRAVPEFNVFVSDYYSKHLPVVLTGGIDKWPALEKWSPDYLQNNFGAADVEIQLGREADPLYERNSFSHKKIIKMSEFVKMITDIETSNDFYMTANNGANNLEGLSTLFDDVDDFGNGYRELDTIKSRNLLWVGPKGTYTPMHHDLINNMLVQVYGRKKVTLIPVFQVPLMYNDIGVYSAANFPAVDTVKYPLAGKITPIEVEIGPGDALFIPIGWWHSVESLSVSISLTFNNFNVVNSFFSDYPR